MSETPTERKRRLRFLTLAEIVGLAALAIAGLGYWDSHRERTLTEKERAAEAQEKKAQAKAGVLKLAFLMTGSPESGGEPQRLPGAPPERVTQPQSLFSPAEVRGDTAETTGNPRIEAGWIEGGLSKAEHGRKPHGRLPVGIVTV